MSSDVLKSPRLVSFAVILTCSVFLLQRARCLQGLLLFLWMLKCISLPGLLDVAMSCCPRVWVRDSASSTSTAVVGVPLAASIPVQLHGSLPLGWEKSRCLQEAPSWVLVPKSIAVWLWSLSLGATCCSTVMEGIAVVC